jgi:hypothetical protein
MKSEGTIFISWYKQTSCLMAINYASNIKKSCNCINKKNLDAYMDGKVLIIVFAKQNIS